MWDIDLCNADGRSQSLGELDWIGSRGLKMQRQQWRIYSDELTRLDEWGGGVRGEFEGWRVSKQVAETWLILPVSWGHSRNYYLCC